jgi:membrane associated rhomboid family serine protease
VLVNVVVYVLQLLEDGVGDQLALPGDPGEIWQRPWTVVTVMFLHEHPLHLALMLAMLVAFGVALERAARSRAVVAVYLGSGVVGAVALVATASLLDVDDPAVGSSAAVLGVAAALLALRPSARLLGGESRQWLAAIVVANIALSVTAPTSSAAHLAGVAVGLLAGRRLRAGDEVDVGTGPSSAR